MSTYGQTAAVVEDEEPEEEFKVPGKSDKNGERKRNRKRQWKQKKQEQKRQRVTLDIEKEMLR